MGVKLVPGCELSHFGRTKYDICYSMYGSHTPALPCIITQAQIQGRRWINPRPVFNELRHLISEFIRKFVSTLVDSESFPRYNRFSA